MPDSPTGRTKYPKSYIIERIDARIASLKSKDGEKDALVADNEMRKGHEALAWIEQVKDKTLRASQDADIILRKLPEVTGPKEAQEAAVMLEKAMDVPAPPWRRRHDWDSKEYKQEQAAAAAVNESKLRAREIYSLEHARAYLVDTPVDEFSLHGLRELKLLEVIQFNLGVQEEEQKRRRR